MDEIIVKRKKGLYYKNLLFAPVTIYFFLNWVLGKPGQTQSWKWLLAILLGVLALFAFISFIKSVMEILKKTPAMIISDSGITDQVSNADAGWIGWNNIVSAEKRKKGSSYYLLIFLKDPLELLDRYSGFRKSAVHLHNKDFGTPLAINTALIDHDVFELINVIEEKTAGPAEHSQAGT
jgi:hypothetical protein